ncbi:MAG: P-II family nitrogen regulator [Chthoniobacteraceae bacterium]
MKMIIAYLPPQFLEPVSSELQRKHIHGMSVSNVHGFGQEHDALDPDHREFSGIERTKKVRLEIACHDSEADIILQTIYDVAHTGLRGNGKVFVLPVLDALRLKTGERGAQALGPKSA